MKFHTESVSHRHAELLVVNGNNGTRSKRSTVETKTNKGKRKGNNNYVISESMKNCYVNLIYYYHH